MKLETAEVAEHYTYRGDYRILRLQAPLVGRSVTPGQFIHLKIPRLNDATLRRPFSIFKADDDGVTVLYKQVGRGTEALAHVTPETHVSIVGPLGNGFPLPSDSAYPVLVAGGYGVAPLYLLASRLPRAGTLFVGGRTEADILCTEEFEALNWDIQIATEDGSRGTTGLVTACLDSWLAQNSDATPEFFACGPDGMLQATGERAIAADAKGWLSLDKHMGCGVGACLACVQKIYADNGKQEWARVCIDGPIFEARQIAW